MRYLLAIFVVSLSVAAVGGEYGRDVARKLTDTNKPHVRVMTERERVVASQNTIAVDVDADPNEIVCQKVRARADSASRVKVRRCKTRAEIREDAERQLAASGIELDEAWRRAATAQSAAGRNLNRMERRNRVRGFK